MSVDTATAEQLFAELTTRRDPFVRVRVEDAPVGVQLWPGADAELFTLARVELERLEGLAWVVWTYRSGAVRRFRVGAKVTCEPQIGPGMFHSDVDKVSASE